MSAPNSETVSALGAGDVGLLAAEAQHFSNRLEAIKAGIQPQNFKWYPYATLASFGHLDRLLHGRNRRLMELIQGRRVADIGCGDGDLAFFLESCGVSVDAIDHPSTNMNGMRGIAALKQALKSSVEIHSIDLDTQFVLPADSYQLVFFLGILYHLKNPFYALEILSRQARYCVLSTRVANTLPSKEGRRDIEEVPIAYLADEGELNNDPTNYWLFSGAGLLRLMKRANWEVLDHFTAGDRQGDQRAWCFARSCYGLANVELLAGWHAPESSGWRWTERSFSFASELPLSSATELRMDIFVPDAYFETGPGLTLEASADEMPLPPATFRTPGNHVYTATLQARQTPTRFDLTLDRALPASYPDTRELAIIVSAIRWKAAE